MSLDISVNAVIETTVISKNITHNLNKMWREAKIYDALYNFQDMEVKEILPILEKGYEELVKYPDKYKKFNSPNGWGTYNQAILWLEELIEEMRKYPNGIIDISK